MKHRESTLRELDKVIIAKQSLERHASLLLRQLHLCLHFLRNLNPWKLNLRKSINQPKSKRFQERVFFQQVLIMNHPPHLNATTKPGIFLGVNLQQHANHLWCPVSYEFCLIRIYVCLIKEWWWCRSYCNVWLMFWAFKAFKWGHSFISRRT